jgi:hypothetical protein
VVSGHTLLTTSVKPLNPSQIRKNTLLTPRFLRSVSTAIQNLAPSPPVPTHRPRTSLSPTGLTPMAAWMGRLATWLSRTKTGGRVDEHRRVDPVQRAGWLLGHLLNHLVGGPRDRSLPALRTLSRADAKARPGRRWTRPRLPAYRLVHPEAHRTLEHVTLHPRVHDLSS